MRTIIFDTGSIISLTLNNLTWVLDPLKKQYGGKFLVCNEAKKELIDNPLRMKRYEFEAMQTASYFRSNVLEMVYNEEIRKKAELLLKLANNCYTIKGSPITIVQRADMEGLAACIFFKADITVHKISRFFFLSGIFLKRLF